MVQEGMKYEKAFYINFRGQDFYKISADDSMFLRNNLLLEKLIFGSILAFLWKGMMFSVNDPPTKHHQFDVPDDNILYSLQILFKLVFFL